MPMEDFSKTKFQPASTKADSYPALYRGMFTMDSLADTFILIPTGTRGFCRINGFNLGRYNRVGPIYTLYVPKTIFKKGENIIEIFEAEHLGCPKLCFLDHPLYFVR